MRNLLNQIIPVLTTTTIAIIVAIVGYTCKEVVKLVPTILDLISAKIGLANYTKLKAVATDIFYKVEEDGRLNKLVNSKISTFENIIKTKFPNITDKEIDDLRQSISGEFNKDK